MEEKRVKYILSYSLSWFLIFEATGMLKSRDCNALSTRIYPLGSTKSKESASRGFRVTSALAETAVSIAVAATVVGAAATILVRRTKASEAIEVSWKLTRVISSDINVCSYPRAAQSIFNLSAEITLKDIFWYWSWSTMKILLPSGWSQNEHMIYTLKISRKTWLFLLPLFDNIFVFQEKEETYLFGKGQQQKKYSPAESLRVAFSVNCCINLYSDISC